MTARFVPGRAGNHDSVLGKLLGLFVAVVVTLGVTLPLPAAGAQDNSAEAVNTKDGKSVFKLAFQVKKTMDDDVQATNTAVAFA